MTGHGRAPLSGGRRYPRELRGVRGALVVLVFVAFLRVGVQVVRWVVARMTGQQVVSAPDPWDPSVWVVVVVVVGTPGFLLWRRLKRRPAGPAAV